MYKVIYDTALFMVTDLARNGSFFEYVQRSTFEKSCVIMSR